MSCAMASLAGPAIQEKHDLDCGTALRRSTCRLRVVERHCLATLTRVAELTH